MRKNIKVISTLGTFAVYVLLLALLDKYVYQYIEQQQTFYADAGFLRYILGKVGGCAILLSDLLVQFFVSPVAGILITSVLLTGITLVSAGIFRKISGYSDCTLLGFVPGLCCIIQLCDMNFHFFGIVALLLALLCLRLYLSFSRSVARLVAGALMTVALYAAAGPVSILFAASALMVEMFVDLRSSWKFALMPAIGIGIAFLLLHRGAAAEIHQLVGPHAYYTLRLKIPGFAWMTWACWGATLLFVCVRSQVRASGTGFRTSISILQAAAIASLVFYGLNFGINRQDLHFRELNQLSRARDWEGIIESYKGRKNDNLLYHNYLAMALAERGELSSNLRRYPFQGIGSMFVESNNTPYVSELLGDVFFSMGEIGMAQRYYFECNEAWGNYSPRMLQMLTVTNLAFGSREVADKYRALLGRTLKYRKWAEGIVSGDNALVASTKRCIFPDNKLSGFGGLDEDLKRVLRVNPDHTATLEYLKAFYLLLNDDTRYQALMDEFGGDVARETEVPVNASLAAVEEVPIVPDYTDVTVPASVAPLNFRIAAGDGRAVFSAPGCSISINGRGGEIRIPEKKWRKLTAAAAGSGIEVSIQRRSDGAWSETAAFGISVSKDEIDPYLAYRLIEPGYEIWDEMGIYQRELSSFREKAVITNNQSDHGCVNCHSFSGGDPQKFLFHARVGYGGTYMVDGGKVRKLNTKTPDTISALVYPQWHVSGRYVAFSVNSTKQMFHTSDPNRVEVFDYASDVVVYDAADDIIFSCPQLKSSGSFETFPTFSPDGRSLYFCTADSLAIPDDYDKVRYSICRIGFNPEDRTFGAQVDTLFNARIECASASFPRVSPDGGALMFTKASYGNFSIWHKDADLCLLDLESGKWHVAEELNSDDAESYHSWSGNGRWVVFGSRRADGLYTRLYIAHRNEDGSFDKPFELPQESSSFHEDYMKSYNIPEFVCGVVKINPRTIHNVAKKDAGKNLSYISD